MFAVFVTGGKQYKGSINQEFSVEKLEFADNEKIKLPAIAVFNEKSQLVSTKSEVEVQIIRQTKDAKKIAFKKERRTTHKRKVGHRQKLTVIKVISINS
jgi:large subunit ribosomal protein L21